MTVQRGSDCHAWVQTTRDAQLSSYQVQGARLRLRATHRLSGSSGFTNLRHFTGPLVLSPDWQHLAVLATPGAHLVIFTVDTLRPRMRLALPRPCTGIQWAPEGAGLACYCQTTSFVSFV